jgi:hypothetical protein
MPVVKAHKEKEAGGEKDAEGIEMELLVPYSQNKHPYCGNKCQQSGQGDIVEKPGLTADRFRELIDASRIAGVELFPGHLQAGFPKDRKTRQMTQVTNQSCNRPYGPSVFTSLDYIHMEQSMIWM